MGDSEASSSTATPKPTVPFFKKARGRPQSSRKRSASPEKASITDEFASDPLASGAASAVIRPTTKATLTTPTVQGTKRLREDREKDRRQSEMEYRANEALKSISEQNDFVTRSADWDLTGDDAAKEGGAIKRPRLDGDGNLLPSDGMYRGKAGYAEYIRPDERTSNKMKAGPQKASSNIRSITVVDYQPDVCKDYKETGFCGYGDSCKFLHDRGDYLAGWQLDKLAVNPTTGEAVADDDSDDEEVPFACLICRKPFTDPVVTKCGHYFCMNCAVDRFRKTPKCYACGAATGGMFNKAEKILQKMAEKNQARQESRRLDAFGNPKSENGDSDAESEEGIQFGGDEEEAVSDDE
ncbi:hypothetical protein QFC22_005393 [Naganishia vaughanmartiniae]|uniref:Uncharacterized protein n=1 Tax=Naganishia vaughanmartiniae TaxID=1424756 RepID=A0ACC2WV67_9TREE|nr:hypothetical protein QFC22_005393 [Naganishia vaughanmartiniae]